MHYDFSEINAMSINEKLHLMEYLTNLRDETDLSEKEATVAAKIFVTRLDTNDFKFIPEELNPNNWH